eukprot:6190343-Pleurochrysis_carterae.AAC.1
MAPSCTHEPSTTEVSRLPERFFSMLLMRRCFVSCLYACSRHGLLAYLSRANQLPPADSSRAAANWASSRALEPGTPKVQQFILSSDRRKAIYCVSLRLDYES